jgi:hypothetical protein
LEREDLVAQAREAESSADQVARLYEQAEEQAAAASERLVGSGGFVSLLGQLAENAAALTKLSSDAMDVVLRNLRVAGRRDVVRLSRQLARTEDKLERVLQEIELLRDGLDRSTGATEATRANSGGAPARSPKAGNSGAPAAENERARS